MTSLPRTCVHDSDQGLNFYEFFAIFNSKRDVDKGWAGNKEPQNLVWFLIGDAFFTGFFVVPYWRPFFHLLNFVVPYW